MAPTPIDARFPASISRSPPLVYKNKVSSKIPKIIQIQCEQGEKSRPYRYINYTIVQRARCNEPCNDASVETHNSATNASPLVCLAPSHTKRNGKDRRAKYHAHECLKEIQFSYKPTARIMPILMCPRRTYNHPIDTPI